MKTSNLTILFLLFTLVLSCQTNRKSNANRYQNPVFEPDLADPTMVKSEDGWFYAYGTQNQWDENVDKLGPIVKSDDLVHWEYVGDVFKSSPNWKTDGGIWAPNINYVNGKYYLYYSKSIWDDPNPGIGLAVSEKPEGAFVDLGKVLDSKSIGVGNSIDPFFIQHKGKNYLFWGSFRGIYGIELANDMKTIVGEKFQIAGNGFEATYIYPKDGKFYFFGSNGNCCEGANSKYRISTAVANTIKGPYLTKNGIDIVQDNVEGTPFLYGDENTGFVGPGHNGEIIVDDKGRYFILYHAIQTSNPLLPNGATRRPLMLDEIKWVDGWPAIERNTPSHQEKIAPYFKK